MKVFQIDIDMDGGICSACHEEKPALWGKRRICDACLKSEIINNTGPLSGVSKNIDKTCNDD